MFKDFHEVPEESVLPNVLSVRAMVADAILIEAVDWGVHSEQVDSDYPHTMPIVVGTLIGFVVDENDERIVIAQQAFGDGGLRSLLSIPKVCIKKRYNLAIERKD